MKQLFVIFSLFLILSCENEKLKVLTLNTTNPQIIPFIEEFNQNNKNIKIILNSSIKNEHSDIIVFKGNPKSSPLETINISDLFNKEIDKKIFYKDLVNHLIEPDGNIKLLPVTFDLTGVIYNSNLKNSNILKVEDFILDKDSTFSPYWNLDFILWMYISNSPNFFKDEKYLDNTIFYQTISLAKEMLTQKDKNWNETEFNKKYMYLSPEHLIRSKIIDYYYYSLSDYLELPNKKNISFSLLSNQNLIMTKDNVTYIGITKTSKYKKEARKVLIWLFNIKNQEQILQNNFKKPEKSRLVSGELSSIKEINKKVLTKYFPELILMLPEQDIITVNSELPPLWSSLKKEIFLPLISNSKDQNNAALETKFNEYYIDWSKKHNK